jgi:RNA polymerase sigma-70 factor (ECF subfamily)
VNRVDVETVNQRSSPPDDTLIRRVSQGDREAFASLYDRYASALFPLAVRIMNDYHEAEEVLQDVFVQVWQFAQSFDARRGSMLSWLVTLTRSRALDRLRALRARGWPSPESPSPDVTGDSFDPLDEALVNEERRRVRGALGSIPLEQRTVIELAYFEGLTQAEIADRLCEPLGTIKTRMRLGMRKLKELLERV